MSAPAVAVTEDGEKVALAWKDVRKGEPNIYWRMGTAIDLGEESLLHDETTGEQDHPTLAFDSSGKLWAAWEDSRTGRAHIWVRSMPGDAARPISRQEEGEAGFPCLANGRSGVAVAWESRKGNRSAVWFANVDASP
jgi:hypothetical protein